MLKQRQYHVVVNSLLGIALLMITAAPLYLDGILRGGQLDRPGTLEVRKKIANTQTYFRNDGKRATLPGAASVSASMGILSSDLAVYLARLGRNVGVVVYDVTHQHYYMYNSDIQFLMGSSIKIPILLAFLDMTERQGRRPTEQELSLLATMIKNSDNASASELYYNKIGGAAGIADFLRRLQIAGLDPNPHAWGYSVTTPLAMVKLLTLLYEGSILTDQDRNLALGLMEQIQADQRMGMVDAIPGEARVAMKSGWVPDPDGLWAVNSSCIVMSEQETFIIAVYVQKQQALKNGQAILQYICRTIASSLT